MCAHYGTRSVHGPPLSPGPADRRRGICRHEGKILFLTLVFVAVVCQTHPIAMPKRGNVSNTEISQTVEFLTKYGYLPSSDPATGNLRSDSQLRQAVATMQRFGGLRPTGLIDDDTVRLMKRRRCGLPDVLPESSPYRVKRYAIQGQKWSVTNLTWSVKSSDTDSDDSMVRAQLRKAFSVWSSASALEFWEVAGQPADIVVSFLKGKHGDGYPFDGEGSVLAHAFFPGEGIGGDAHFDAEERWLPSQPDSEHEGVNLFAVAAHEIGHSLGLSHSSTPGSLMFPYYQVMGEYFTLPKDDADGIRHLYGLKDLESQPTMPTISPTLPTDETKTKSTTKKISLKPTKSTKSSKPDIKEPDVCNTSIDAISIIRREVFVFKGRHFWRLDSNLTVRAGYPVAIDRFWNDLPTDLEKIDAVYERPADTKIVFFIGNNFWLFSANVLEPGYPRPLTDLGLPEDLTRVDAAMVWGHNGKTYLFSGKEYWKYDEEEGRVELDYPRNINLWKGLPPNLDAAFQWIDGNTYFFKDRKFWKFFDVKMGIGNKTPADIGQFWFKCQIEALSDETVNVTASLETTIVPTVVQSNTPSGSAIVQVPNLFLNCLLVFYVFCQSLLLSFLTV